MSNFGLFDILSPLNSKGIYDMRKRLLSLLILTIYIVLPMGIAVNADSDVVVSSQEYTVYYTAGSSDNFLCNKKSVGSQPGTEYYLT